MDTNVAGLNKVVCFTTSSSYNGKTVSITDGVNTWTDVLDSLSCVFMIPSMPAPAKRTYTVTLHDGDETASAIYERDIELGFGDSVQIGLYANDENANKGYVASYFASSSRYATSGTAGTVKVGDRMEISSGAINPANISYGTSGKTSGSSYLKTGTIYCQYS